MINKIFIHITYECNAKCVHCAVPKFKGALSLEDFKKIVDISKRSGVEYIILGGGEPLTHPDVIEMIHYVKDNDMKVKIETNGKLLNKILLDKLKDIIFQINISLDGLNPKTHNSIRLLDTFQNTIEAISYARKIGIDVAIWSVVMKDNITELNQMITLLENVDIKKISFLYATPVEACFRNKKDILADIDKYYSFIKEIDSKNKDVQIRIAPYLIPYGKIEEFEENYGSEIPNKRCMIYDKEIIHIAPSGNIFPCVLLLSDEKYCLGNINNSNDLENILQGNTVQWDKILTILNNYKQISQKNGYNDLGCIGLCNSFNTDTDPRATSGVLVCPCRTIRKEWNY